MKIEHQKLEGLAAPTCPSMPILTCAEHIHQTMLRNVGHRQLGLQLLHLLTQHDGSVVRLPGAAGLSSSTKVVMPLELTNAMDALSMERPIAITIRSAHG